MYHVLHLQPVCAHQYPSILGFSRVVFVVVCSEINLTELLLRGGAGWRLVLDQSVINLSALNYKHLLRAAHQSEKPAAITLNIVDTVE